MRCTDKTIGGLLPGYIGGELGPDERKRVEAHCAACEACRAERTLLMLVSEETVPDPGEAFWNAMPDRIYRAVQAAESQQQEKKNVDLFRFGWLLLLPRWTWAAAAMAAVLLVVWLTVAPFHHAEESALNEVYDYSYGSMHDPNLTHPSTNVSDLSVAELDSVESWVGSELHTAASDAEAVIVADSDPAEELAEMDHPEMERLSRSLDNYEEG